MARKATGKEDENITVKKTTAKKTTAKKAAAKAKDKE